MTTYGTFEQEERPTSSVNMPTGFHFSGKETDSVFKAQALLKRLELNFICQESMGKQCLDIYKVVSAVNQLTGPALNWYTHRFVNPPSWLEFKEAFIQEYCPTDEFEIRSAAARYNATTQENKSVEQYIREFEKFKALLPADYELECATRDRFIQNLKPQIRSRIFQLRPESYNEAKFLAKDLEKNNNFYKPNFRKHRFNEDRRGEPMDVDNLRTRFNDYKPRQSTNSRNSYNYNNSSRNNNSFRNNNSSRNNNSFRGNNYNGNYNNGNRNFNNNNINMNEMNGYDERSNPQAF